MTLEMKLQEWEYIGMQKGLERGMEKGLAQGMENGAKSRAESIAVKMLRKGRPIDEISEFTELSDEAINQLKSKL